LDAENCIPSDTRLIPSPFGTIGRNIETETMAKDLIKDGKIWIQRNTTEADLAQELVEMGVPKEDIVLGLQPPYKRPYTGYGVA
jgi:XisI protein